MAINNDREHAQELLDHLDSDQIAAVVHVMEVMLDPVSRKLANAPLEDEPVSAEEEEAASRARGWLKHNRPISHEDVLADLELTVDDFERMGQTPRPASPERQGR